MPIMSVRAQSALAVCLVMHRVQDENHGTPVTAIDLAIESGFSVSYIEQVIADLRVSGIVSGVRGPGGGYRVRGDATIAELLRAMDKDWDMLRDTKLPCVERVRFKIDNFLKDITLEEITESCKASKAA